MSTEGLSTKEPESTSRLRPAEGVSPPDRDSLLALSLPVLITALIGAIYATGAVTKMGQLMHAGYETRDLFAAIPLEQHLARGLQISLAPVLLLLLLLYVWNLSTIPPSPRTTEEWEKAEARRRATLKFLWPLWAVALLAVVLLVPLPLVLEYSIGAAVAGFVYIIAFWEPALLRATGRAVAFVIATTFWVAYAFAGAFITPNPLPHVQLQTQDSVVGGALLLRADGDWYVGQPRDRFTVVRGEAVRRSIIRSREPEEHDSLVDRIFG